MTPERFFKDAWPLLEKVTPEGVVVWWSVKGSVVRSSVLAPGRTSLVLVEPNTPEMDQFLDALAAEENPV